MSPSQQRTFRHYTSGSLLMACLGVLSSATAAPVEDPAASASNIFSSPRKSDEIPRYVRRDRQQMNRRMMGEMDGIPGWQELKVLPSLNADQRKKIHDLFEQSKRDAEPLVQELKELRQKPAMHQIMGPEPLEASKARGAFGGGDFRQARIPRPDSPLYPVPVPEEGTNAPFPALKDRHNSQDQANKINQITQKTLGPNMLPFGTQKGAFRMGPAVNSEQIAKVRNLQRELRNKRLSAWDQVKVLLTEQNLKDLELMRKGELLPESLKADSREPASSSLSKNAQPDFPPMMMAPVE